MSNQHDPRLHFSGRPKRPEQQPPEDEATFKLLGPEGDFDEPTRATVLDPDSWSSEVPYTASAPAPMAAEDVTLRQAPAAEAVEPEPSMGAGTGSGTGTGGLRRFGPGVPGPNLSGSTSHTAAVWHGTVRPGDAVAPAEPGKRRGRALRGWLLPVVVLLAVLAYLAWQHLPGSAKVDAVSVRNDTAVQGCHSTAKVIGTLKTSGGAGTVRYRWKRSDGTVSDELKQHVAKGHRSTDVVLLWSFDGPGTLNATATLEVLAPQQRSAAVTFAYRCR